MPSRTTVNMRLTYRILHGFICSASLCVYLRYALYLLRIPTQFVKQWHRSDSPSFLLWVSLLLQSRNFCCDSQCVGIQCPCPQRTPLSLPGTGRCHPQQTWAPVSALQSKPRVVWWQIQTLLEHWLPCSSLLSLWLFYICTVTLRHPVGLWLDCI